MKKLFTVFITLLMFITLTGCTKRYEEEDDDEYEESEPSGFGLFDRRSTEFTDETTLISLCLYVNGPADSNTERVVFGLKSDYDYDEDEGMAADVAGTGNIRIYSKDDTIYILSNDLIYLNPKPYYNGDEPYGIFDSSLSSYGNIIRSITFDNVDTSKATVMSYMFFDCRSLESLDLSSFDTSNVTAMKGMFTGCGSLEKLDVSSFDTSNVTDMSEMFSNCSSLEELDLRSFDTRNLSYLHDYSNVFNGCNAQIYTNPETWTIMKYYGK